MLKRRKMSKSAKNNSKSRRLKEKRRKKDAARALYEGYRKAGTNGKSKRQKKKLQKEGEFRAERHLQGDCGNTGCSKCNPPSFKGVLLQGKAFKIPQKMWMKMNALGLFNQKKEKRKGTYTR